jgi:acyl carrier protein
MSYRKIILESFDEALENTGNTLTVSELTDDVVLLESGLDSLGFAILVATLDEKLDFDPFVEMTEPVYPTTFGEFIDIYDSFVKSSGT